MGLDLVELVMRVEEEFRIDITDEDAEKSITVGMLHQLVMEKLNAPEAQRTSIWDKLRFIIAQELGVELEKITLDAKFVDDLGAD